MTDEELIARLRKADEYEPLGHDGWEAADRIEALVAEVARLERELDYMAREADMNEEEACAVENDLLEAEAYARELEAKLAKAVEEAEKYQYAFAAQSRKLQSVLHIDGVRTTLAELTGGKDD